MTNHTPTPWYYDAKLDIRREIPGVSYPVAQVRTHDYVGDREARANAAFIIRACNSHEALVEACDLVQRAHVGDGVTMAEAVDACLLAIDLANKE